MFTPQNTNPTILSELLLQIYRKGSSGDFEVEDENLIVGGEHDYNMYGSNLIITNR